MLLEGLMDTFYNFFYILTYPINIPLMPDDIYMMMDKVFEYLDAGLGLLASYTHLEYLLILFSIVVSVEIGFFTYKIVMWILKKIPMANIH